MLYNALWATPLLRGGHRKNIFCQKIFVTPSVFKLQKWFFHQNGVDFNHKSKSDVQCVDGSRKAQKCKEDAYMAEINNDPLVAHSAM